MASFSDDIHPMRQSERKNTGRIKTVFVYFFLIVAGIIFSVLAVLGSEINGMPDGTPLSLEYMSLRLQWLDAFISEVKTAGIYTGLHRLYDHNAIMYLYLSRLGKFLGSDAVQTFRVAQLSVTFLWVSAIPCLWYRATHSVTRALSTGIFFLLFCPYSVFLPNDSYYISAMITFVALPVLFFLFREKWSKQHILWIIFLRLVAGGANVFRSQAGLGTFSLIILLITLKLIVPAFKNKSRKERIKSAGVLLSIFLCYSLFTSFIPSAYQKITGQPEPLPIKGPWHALYVGLGWEENPLKIEYYDSYGYWGNEELLYDTSDGYYIGIESPQYISRMKDEYFQAIKIYPSFFFGSYIRKFFTCLKTVWQNSVINPNILKDRWFYPNDVAYWIYWVCIPIALVRIVLAFTEKDKNTKQSFFEFFFIALILFLAGLLPGLVSIPYGRWQIIASVAVADNLLLIAIMLTSKTVAQILKRIIIKIKNLTLMNS